jgi:5-formyltetrahydrofolate cyclo-ligase
MPGADHERKTRARAEAKARRDGMSAEERRRRSEDIARRVVGLEEWREAATVMLYAAFGSEVETEGLVRAALGEGKRVVLPRTDKVRRVLELHYVCDPVDEHVAPGTWGIPEPRADRCGTAEATDIDLVVAPGLAFDEEGGRLGYGGGYYDRMLRDMDAKGHRPKVVALAYERQIAGDVPRGRGDWPVGVVVTEGRDIRVGEGA